MGSAPHTTLLFIKSEFYYKEVNTGIIIVGVIYNEPANSTTKIILSNDIANNIMVVVAVI